MLLRDALESAIQTLTQAGVGSPRLNGELLLMHTLDRDRSYLYAHPERLLTSGEQSRYADAISQRARGLPAQYITGHQEFWGLDFLVSPAVLIPRPETEHLIETVLRLIGTHSPDPSPRIVDVGTGSGCIAIALAKELPSARIDAADNSPAALEIARANAARHDLLQHIRFAENDLLRGFAPAAFDFVVSNPPYVGEAEADQVQLEVRKFEPLSAVFAGPTGLEVIERLIPQALAVLKPGAWLVLEISGTIAGSVRHLLHSWSEVIFTNDLQNIPRVAAARKH